MGKEIERIESLIEYFNDETDNALKKADGSSAIAFHNRVVGLKMAKYILQMGNSCENCPQRYNIEACVGCLMN